MFDSKVGKKEVIQTGIYQFDSKPFIVKSWTADIDFSREKLLIVPIWIKFLRLNLIYRSSKGLCKLVSLIEKPLMIDQSTEKKTSLNFAKIIEVEVGMDARLLESINFKNKKAY